MATPAPSLLYRTLSRIGNVDITPQMVKTAWRCDGTKLVLKSWAAFAGSHFIMSSDFVRPKLIELAGSEERFRVGYSAVQTAILGIGGYKWWHLTPFQKGPVFFDRYHRMSPTKLTSAMFRIIGTLFISESFLTAIKNPLAFNSYFSTQNPEDQREWYRKWQAFGMQRITRHSLFFGYSLYAIGMMLMARRTLCDLLLWGLVPVFSILGAKHQERRKRLISPDTYWKETSFWPWGAYLEGRQYSQRLTAEIPPSAYSAAFCMMG
eukprot:UN02213